MPVTARLSKKFYDTFGEELAQEMVDWFNQVDATGSIRWTPPTVPISGS
jgi:hypothetical protein